MSKGDGSKGGAVGAGAVGGRAAAFAKLIGGVIVVAGVGFALTRPGVAQQIKTAPSKLTWMMLEAMLNRGVRSIRDSDVLVDTTPVSVGRGAKLADGRIVTPVATGKQIKQALRIVRPTYEMLANRIDLSSAVGSGGTEGTAEAARQRMRKLRFQRRLVRVVIMELDKQRGRGGGSNDGGAA